MKFGNKTKGRVAFLWFLSLFLSFCAAAAENVEIEVTVPKTLVYSKPKIGSKVVGQLARGRRFLATGPAESGFYQLKSKSGKSLFVQAVDVRELAFEASDLFEVPSQKGEGARQGEQPRLRTGPYLSWDLGASAGAVGEVSYTEANLGLNWFLKDWLAWRNAGFYRFLNAEGFENVYGLDSMFRLYSRFDWSELVGVTFFGGPGYRFISQGDNVPFAEGGVILKLAGLSLGGGVRTFFTQLVNDEAENDTQFFIILSGSGII